MQIDRLKEFQKELDRIEDKDIRTLVEACILEAPEYFFFVPASSSGKYHPKSDLGIGGTIRHTKNAFWLSESLLEHPQYDKFTPYTKDCIRVAILLHDSIKYGVEGGEHTVAEHPLLVRPYYLGIVERYEVEHIWSDICDLVETHMGVWTKNRNGEEILKKPETLAQWFVHNADYISSRSFIDIDLLKAETMYSKAKENTSEKASTAQLQYISALKVKVVKNNIEFTEKNPVTKNEASEYIKYLLSILG